MTIDLSRLPAPPVVEPLDFETIVATIKADVIALDPSLAEVIALESEPIVKLVEVFGYRELLLRARINNAARATMLAYAEGADLDNLAALLGTKRLDGETDDRLRARTQIAVEGLSTAGPVLSYVYHALSASNQVADVLVDSPIPGDVVIVVLAVPSNDNPGGVPGKALLAQVLASVDADDVRPLNDNVSTVAAEIITYKVDASIVCLPGPDSSVVLNAARAACEKYVTGQFRLGYDITISGLHAAMHQPGVMRVDIASPADNIVIRNNQAARCTGVNIAFCGVSA